MKRFGKVAWVAGWFALAATGHVCAAGMGGVDNGPIHTRRVVFEDKLDDIRGGFGMLSLAGSCIPFDINRVIFISGNLVVSVSVSISDVVRMTTTQAQQLASVVSTANIVQNGPSNVVPSDVVAGGTAATTAVQSSLNSQTLQAVTTINTTVNSLSQFHQMNLSNMLQGVLANVVTMLRWARAGSAGAA